MSGRNPIPLAIVGIGCRLPGDATSPEKLWDMLANGKSAWSKVPADRWNEEAFLHPDPDDTNGTHNHAGGHFLKQDIGAFDASFFNVLPQEAAAMDPQQRLLLETTYEALESAGIRQEDIQKSNTAVYMAMFTRDYDRNVYKDMMSIPKYHVTGTGDAILANRISHLFDLNGPSATMDTGCSGGMTAISHACQALRSGQSDMALAGAANLILSPDHMISMSNLHMLNADGRSYSFDSRGAGYGRGEGIATLVIKRLDDAIRDNDPIRAVLLDAAVNQDGHTAGITLPSGAAQKSLERRVWENLNIHTQDVGYVEAHGTGTLAGDSAELEGISQVFCQNRDPSSPLLVGSIKSNIGHLESVSGLAAMIKSILILEHGAIPPNVNFEYPRASLDLEKKKIKVPQALEPWSQPGVARISINSFGYGGANAHAVLERPSRLTATEQEEAVPDEIPRLFILTAASQSSLLSMLGTTEEWVSKNFNQKSLRDLSYTLSQRRSIMPWRFSCAASNQAELLEALNKGAKKTDSITRISPDVRISFVFTGQGAQWAGMGCELLSDPTYRDSIHQSTKILHGLGATWNLVEELLRGKEQSRLKEAELAQPATTAIQIALVDLVRRWGIIPDAVVGHSSGEIAAAYAAGYLSQHEALKISYFRGFSSAISKNKGLGKGGMLAVGVGEHDVAQYIGILKQGVAVVACQNSPSSTTISGDDAAISELSEILTQKAIFNRKLNVDTAYHSHHMQAAADEYKAGLGYIVQDALPKTTIKMFSSVTGSLKSSGFDGDYWTSNLTNKVRFCDALQSLCREEQTTSRSVQPHRIFIEIGPHSALAGPARQCIADLEEPMPYSYTSALVRGTGALQSALTMVGSVFNHGYQVNLAEISASDPTSVNASVLYKLPSYPWDHSKRHWHESRLSRDYRLRKHPYHDLLGLRMTDNTPLRPAWRHMIGVEGLPWLRDHVVDGLMIFPGAGYLCMAMEAAVQLAGDRHQAKKIRQIQLEDVSFLKGLVIPEGRTRVEVQLSFYPVEAIDNGKTMQHSFSVTAYTGDEHWNEHCRGLVSVEFASENDQNSFETPITYGEISDQFDTLSTKSIQPDDLYQELERVGNAYGPTFTGIEEFTLESDRAISLVMIPDVVSVMPARHIRPHIIHPSTLDIILHGSLPLVNQKLGAGSVMPVRIGDLTISSEVENAPGKMLSAVTTLTSTHFRAAEADLVVFPGKAVSTSTPVISVSGMELRSLASNDIEDAGIRGGREICYEMKWGPDERFLSEKQLEPLQAVVSDDPLAHCYALMSQYLEHKAFKQSKISVIEIGGVSGGATLSFLQALQSYGARPSVYDFGFKDTLGDVESELQDWSDVVTFKPLDIETDTSDQGFEQNSYDVVLVCNTLPVTKINVALSSMRNLLKPDGVLLLIETTTATQNLLSRSEWSNTLSEASLKLQLAAQVDDSMPKSTFIVARAVDNANIDPLPEIEFIIEPTLSHTMKNFVTEISMSNALHSKEVQITTTSWESKQTHKDVIHVVIDDGSNPILAGVGPEKFQSVVDLLQRPSKVIWISAQDEEKDMFSPRKHLITGLARTAHAENEDLAMVTIDVQQTLDQKTKPAILNFLMEVLQSFNKANIQREREYVYNGTDVLIPRVIPSGKLNRQVSGNDETITETKMFTASRVPLKLDNQKKDSFTHPVFVEDEIHRQDLGKDCVEIEGKAFGIPSQSPQHSNIINEYSGVVTATGSDVSSFKVGDSVVAFSSVPYAQRLRVPATQVQLIPRGISFIMAAALPISFMNACHALIDIANIQPGETVLIDGAATDIGQAAISVAKHLGAEVIAAVSRVDEVNFLKESFKIPSSHIIPRESYLGRHRIQKLVGPGGLSVVLGCAKSSVSNEIIEFLQPFGTLVQIGGSGKPVKLTKAVSNVTVSTFDLEFLVRAKPQKASQLLQKVMEMASQGLTLPSQNITALPLDNIDEALKQARHEDVNKYVLEVQEHSTVRAARPSYTLPKLDSGVTYLVAGGMGDLGRRLLRLMAKAGARYLVTLSRRGATPAEREKVEKELQEFGPGCSLYCIKCDVSKETSTTAALSEITAKGFPQVKGVIQATVALRDSTLDTMTAEDFNSVLQAKAQGTLNLKKTFASEDLEFFISFSSAVNIIGTAGQANYNAGNSLQDALAQFDRSPNCFYMSLNIGTIEDATVNNEAIIQSLRRQGLTPVLHNELLALFEYALSAEARETGCHQAVIGFTPETIAGTTAINGSAHTPMFTHVRQADEGGVENDATNKAKTFKDIIGETSSKDEISAFVAQVIGKKLAELIAIDPVDVNLGSSITDFGLDSLIAIELRNWMMREFDAPIQSSEVLDNQNIWTLAQKVTMRSRLANGDGTDSSSSSEGNVASTLPTSRSPSQERQKRAFEQPPLPIPDLGETLRFFADSRKGICSPEELAETERVIEEFQSSGLELQDALRVNPSGPDSRLEFYENNIHIERREPLQDHALFYIGHLTDGAPTHSQAERAAIVTVATLDFKKRYESGKLEQNSLNDIPLCMETMKWMFNSVQEPRKELDKAQKYASNNNVIVLRRGHIFEIAVREEDNYTSLTALFTDIIASSEHIIPPVSVLTSKRRDHWAELRSKLRAVKANAVLLEAIESAAFVISLDDSSPVTSSERCTSILLNDLHLTNRWLDKILQLTVAANGVSSILAENSKLDGLSTRQLNEYITDEIFHNPCVTPLNEKPIPASTVRELQFEIPSTISKAIAEQTKNNLSHYNTIGASRHYYSELSRSFLGSKGLRSKGTVLISILLANRLFYGYFEPIWETVTVSKYAKGRIDWLQNLTPDIVHWIEKALEFMEDGKGDVAELASKLKDAAIGHAQTLRRVADGRGYVEPLYSLMGTSLAEGKPLPPLFSSSAWRHSDRNLTPKRAKTDCLGSGGYMRMQEGGFLMPNPNSVFVHYEVHHPDPLILVQGREDDVARFEDCLNESIRTVRAIIERGLSKA
ncbi:Lovastatin nonaketide synthase [Talaromyces islandicus]|uniref:Lovastatin nonaketide synthase n=1 Tax=Talaromyces islandicus TaxID=28573 RepID=A0A0U1MAY5_TALIS|nr:Lovastatin nonaketide synthase [Talaromyces islandicus]